MAELINNSGVDLASLQAVAPYIFLVVFALTALVSLVLCYHWIRFSVGALSLMGVCVVYLSGTGLVLAGMLLALKELYS